MVPSDESARFENQTVVVTGAGSGIGRATAVRLLDEGARVIAVDLVPDRLDELVASTSSNGRLVTIAGDLLDPGTSERILAETDGRLDGLANVAGIMDGFLPAAEVDDATWDRVMGVNVTAVMRLTRAVLPLMLAAGSGAIVNVASEAGLRGSAAGAAYTASKHAVIGYTKSTAFFYTAHGVRCNAVAPGPVATNIEAPFKSQFATERLGALMQVAIPAVASPENLAAAITWLLSADSANVSGAVLPSDGGWSAM